jgi:hypothetical protein
MRAQSLGVLAEIVRAHRVLLRGGDDLERARGKPLLLVRRLLRLDVDAFRVPHGARAVGQRAVEIFEAGRRGGRGDRRHAHGGVRAARRRHVAGARRHALERAGPVEERERES